MHSHPAILHTTPATSLIGPFQMKIHLEYHDDKSAWPTPAQCTAQAHRVKSMVDSQEQVDRNYILNLRTPQTGQAVSYGAQLHVAIAAAEVTTSPAAAAATTCAVIDALVVRQSRAANEHLRIRHVM